MQSYRVIPTLDVAKAGPFRLGPRCEPATAEQLGFEGGEEALGHGVVVGVTDRSHRWSNTGLATPLTKCHRRILTALVAVVDDVLGPPLANRQFHRVLH